MEGISSKNHGDFYCYGCFHSFRTQSTLNKHTELCKSHKFCQVILPKEKENFKYHKIGTKALKQNNMIYPETLLPSYDRCDNKNTITKEINKHEVCGYSINVVSNSSKTTHQTYYRGKEALTKFCTDLRETGTELFNIKKKPMIKLNEKQQNDYEKAEYCHICKEKFNKNDKVRDHDHYTGKFSGAAHLKCNLRYKAQKDIPVIFHNGSNYDFNLIITELAKEFRSEMRCIPLNK